MKVWGGQIVRRQTKQRCSIRREMKVSERFVTHFSQNLTILPASLFLQTAHSHFRGETFAGTSNWEFPDISGSAEPGLQGLILQQQ
jgi:hypothetical protein